MDRDKKVTHIDSKRVAKLEKNGHYTSLLEEFDILRAKLMYSMNMDATEAVRLVTLTKYFLKHAHSEAFRLHVQHIYDRYIKDYNL
jgi:hypothetical protein